MVSLIIRNMMIVRLMMETVREEQNTVHLGAGKGIFLCVCFAYVFRRLVYFADTLLVLLGMHRIVAQF